MRIMFVLPRFPYPLDKGDKLRAYHQIRILSEYHEISLFCISHEGVEPEHVDALRKYCTDIVVVKPNRLVSYKNVLRNFLRSKSLQIGYWDSKKARRKYKEFENKVQPDVIYSQMVRTMPIVSRRTLPKVMDFQDALSMNTERRMDHTRPGFWHWVLHYEFKMLRSSEYNAFKIFDDLVIISETDSEAIPHRKNSDIKVIPNGVDFEYYAPMECEKKYEVMFCGNMQYEPNVNAAKYLVEEIMPIVWKHYPNARLLIAGTSPKASVKNLANDRVEVSGWVEDMRECYASAQVFVAPMQMGSGLQNKLLEAMSMELPCVTTPIANDSLGSNDEVLVGHDAQEIADDIIKLLSDENYRNQLAHKGREFIKQNYSWEVYGRKLESILENVCKK